MEYRTASAPAGSLHWFSMGIRIVRGGGAFFAGILIVPARFESCAVENAMSCVGSVEVVSLTFSGG